MFENLFIFFFKRPLETPEEQAAQPAGPQGSRLPAYPTLTHDQVLCSNEWKFLLDSATQKFRHSSRKLAPNSPINAGFCDGKPTALSSLCLTGAGTAIQNRNSFDLDERNLDHGGWGEKKNGLDSGYFNPPTNGLHGIGHLNDEYKTLGLSPEDNRLLGQYLSNQRAGVNFDR